MVMVMALFPQSPRGPAPDAIIIPGADGPTLLKPEDIGLAIAGGFVQVIPVPGVQAAHRHRVTMDLQRPGGSLAIESGGADDDHNAGGTTWPQELDIGNGAHDLPERSASGVGQEEGDGLGIGVEILGAEGGGRPGNGVDGAHIQVDGDGGCEGPRAQLDGRLGLQMPRGRLNQLEGCGGGGGCMGGRVKERTGRGEGGW